MSHTIRYRGGYIHIGYTTVHVQLTPWHTAMRVESLRSAKCRITRYRRTWHHDMSKEPVPVADLVDGKWIPYNRSNND